PEDRCAGPGGGDGPRRSRRSAGGHRAGAHREGRNGRRGAGLEVASALRGAADGLARRRPRVGDRGPPLRARAALAKGSRSMAPRACRYERGRLHRDCGPVEVARIEVGWWRAWLWVTGFTATRHRSATPTPTPAQALRATETGAETVTATARWSSPTRCTSAARRSSTPTARSWATSSCTGGGPATAPR